MKEKQCCGECKWWDVENKISLDFGSFGYSKCVFVFDKSPDSFIGFFDGMFAGQGKTCPCFERRKP